MGIFYFLSPSFVPAIFGLKFIETACTHLIFLFNNLSDFNNLFSFLIIY